MWISTFAFLAVPRSVTALVDFAAAYGSGNFSPMDNAPGGRTSATTRCMACMSRGHSTPMPGRWTARAYDYHWHVSSTPSVGAIVDLQPWVKGAYTLGHVAVVERIFANGDVIASNMKWAPYNWQVTNVRVCPRSRRYVHLCIGLLPCARK